MFRIQAALHKKSCHAGSQRRASPEFPDARMGGRMGDGRGWGFRDRMSMADFVGLRGDQPMREGGVTWQVNGWLSWA